MAEPALWPARWFRIGARVRGLTLMPGMLGIVACLAATALLPAGQLRTGLAITAGLGGFALVMVGGVLTFLPVAPRLPARPIAAPVGGRWSALNSPGSAVPSHGTHGHGQTFAIDLIYDPADGSRPAFGGRGFRPPTDFPGFGQPILAPAAGRVVAVRDGARDHRSRSNWLAIGYLLLAGVGRELAGSRFVLGNHVVLDLGDGSFAVLAHLQRGSVAVRPGEPVTVGQPVGRCGNSGNSSEPHLHLQLMDHRWPLVAAGLPITFPGGPAGSPDGLPRNGEAVTFRLAGQPTQPLP